ncbi:MAG: hypothetical protein M9899_01435 [Bdellovibrionaceae bacterium]|nr:hypothetical protein [Pseudobdellovibrionaceae bacterium]
MKHEAFKSISNMVWSFIFIVCVTATLTFLDSSPADASNRTTCNIKSGFKIYYILKNGKLGKRDYSTGSTKDRTYTCIKDRYYHRILINGKWRYVSVDAETTAPVQQSNVDEPHPTTEEADAEGVDNLSGDAPRLSEPGTLTNQLALKSNYNIRNANGDRIGSTFGIDASKQNVQVKLSAPNTPIVNADGLVSVQYNYLNSRGRSESVDAWISPEAIINYDQVIKPAASGGVVYTGDDTTRGTPAVDTSVGASEKSTPAAPIAAEEFNIDNPNIPKAGEQINILRGIDALIPKTQPFLASEPMDGVKPLNSGSELIATGNRKCDRDSKKCFVEVEFSDDTDGEFVGWIDEQQTTVNPTYHLAGGQSGGSVITSADSD